MAHEAVPEVHVSIATRILDIGERLIQTSGYNGFSYAHIARELGITTATLHYYYRTKADLGQAILRRYSSRFARALEEISQERRSALHDLERYAALYSGVIAGERMCLCGMLAAEHTTLPAPMVADLRAFFDLNESWVAAVLAKGVGDGSLTVDDTPLETARWLVGALEGAMLVARPYHDPARFDRAAARLLRTLTTRSHAAEAAG
ncbi:MAG: TetR/AcrR family transcriptional regulator [Dehalococcoidia bacterium]